MTNHQQDHQQHQQDEKVQARFQHTKTLIGMVQQGDTDAINTELATDITLTLAADPHGHHSPLRRAIELGDKDMVAFLVEKGASFHDFRFPEAAVPTEIQTGDEPATGARFSALRLAWYEMQRAKLTPSDSLLEAREEIFNYILECSRQTMTAHEAVCFLEGEILEQWLIDHPGTNFNQHAQHQVRTPLHLAAAAGLHQNVTALLYYSADATKGITYTNGSDGEHNIDWTPLHDATIIACDLATVQVLLQHHYEDAFDDYAAPDDIQTHLDILNRVLAEDHFIAHAEEGHSDTDAHLATQLKDLHPEFDDQHSRNSGERQARRQQIIAVIKLTRYYIKIRQEYDEIADSEESIFDFFKLHWRRGNQLRIKEQKALWAKNLFLKYINNDPTVRLEETDDHLENGRLGKCFRRLQRAWEHDCTITSTVGDGASDASDGLDVGALPPGDGTTGGRAAI